jgi:hypothetical protein
METRTFRGWEFENWISCKFNYPKWNHAPLRQRNEDKLCRWKLVQIETLCYASRVLFRCYRNFGKLSYHWSFVSDYFIPNIDVWTASLESLLIGLCNFSRWFFSFPSWSDKCPSKVGNLVDYATLKKCFGDKCGGTLVFLCSLLAKFMQLPRMKNY